MHHNENAMTNKTGRKWRIMREVGITSLCINIFIRYHQQVLILALYLFYLISMNHIQYAWS
jgi:hypothetical protein